MKVAIIEHNQELFPADNAQNSNPI